MDAVPGRKAPKASGSSPDPTYCQPCAEEGKKIHPEAFCPVCKEFLCSNCARVHRNMKLTKSHALQDKSSMPSSFRAESGDEKFTETCQSHSKEFIKYYCPHHDALLCGDCVVEKAHRLCNIDKISQLAKRYKEDVEYKSMKSGLLQMSSDIGKLSYDIEASMKSVDEESLTNINEFRKFRNEINQYLDKREKELLADIDQKKMKSKSQLTELKSKCTKFKSATEKLKSEMQAQENNSNQLLIVGKRAMKELSGLQSALDDVERKRVTPRYKFSRDPGTEQLLASQTAIGRVEEVESTSAFGQQQRQQETKQQHQQPGTKQQQQKDQQAVPQKVLTQSRADLTQAQFNRQPDIPVKTSADTHDCWLTSVALLPRDRVLLADGNNRSVKLVDTKTNKVVSTVKLSGMPWDLCLLPGDRVAVTLPDEGTIQIMSTQGQLAMQDSIKVDKECRGIAFYDDNLIVSFSTTPGKVVLMDMKGNVTKTVGKDSRGNPLLEWPYYLTVIREGQTSVIYVSDVSTHTITKLSFSLQVLQTFSDPALIAPRGLKHVGDNQLLVCGYHSDNIVLLNTSTGKMTQLLGKGEGVVNPYSVDYCPRKEKIFVTCSPSKRPELENFVKVFNVV